VLRDSEIEPDILSELTDEDSRKSVSRLGLGLCLVGIGYLYQRFVMPLPSARAAGQQS
jgi:uncharacterized membrane protein